jgi:hypothetical protein
MILCSIEGNKYIVIQLIINYFVLILDLVKMSNYFT